MEEGKTECRFASVMLIDDSKFDNIVNKRLIEMGNFATEILVFTNGRDAIGHLEREYLQSQDTVSVPEVIFLDINMPLMDGFEFLEAFAQLPEVITEAMSVVMLTSSINPEDEARSVKSRFVSRYLYKPLTIEKLNSLF